MEQDRLADETTEQEITEEQGSALELDISIIHEPDGDIMSLSDFFGIPVFKDGLLFKNGSYIRLRLPEHQSEVK